ncbi:ABC transporter ATP-binding protein [Mycoplasma elephantis]|uniref:ABC transporter ATP-binding protein n=1 Tax=Mycoplasma elephantis TaxID=114882 RepID=UPI000486875A|nr:ABC transporter ATP-binding protein [Mycoplasma elephantis]
MFALLRMTSRKYRIYMVFSMLFTIVNVFMTLLFSRLNASFIPLLLKRDEITKIDIDFVSFDVKNTSEAIWILAGLILLNTFFSFLSAILSIIFSAKAFANVTREIRTIIFEKIQKMPIQDIDNITVGALMTRLTSDAMMAGMVVQTISRTLVTAPIMLVGAVILAIIVNPGMSFFLAILIPTIFFVVLIIGFKTNPLIKNRQKTVDLINNEARENILGIRVIKSYNLENEKRNNFNESIEKWTKLNIKLNRIFWLMNPIVFTIINILISGILMWGGYLILDTNKNMDIKYLESVTAFIDFMILISFAILQLTQILVITMRGRISAKRIKTVLNSKNSFDDVISDKYINSPSIEFKNVTFKYKDIYNKSTSSSKNTIENISFKIKPYESLGIIGNSGSGKTTIANLIVRNFLPDNGEIIIDDKNINEINTENLNSNISITFQESILNSGTIKENLLFANKNATNIEIERAASASLAKHFIDKFPDKYEHKIVQRGKNLSGGQKQRLSIARSLLKRSKILILDDSTSALDALTEKAVKNNIKNNFKLTTIIISQKISAVRDCDNIILLDKGRIIANGSHENLLANSFEYKKIVQEQGGE